ncbi:MAG: NUDIX domain-containing protein [Lautropia sp.]
MTSPPFETDPSGTGLRETTVESATVFQGRMLTVKRDIARLPDGSTASREFVVHPGASAMVPIAADERILVERQFRYAMGEIYFEIPAGKLDPGETPLATAKRELVEETGYRAARWAHLTRIHPAIGFSTELLDIFLARDLEQVSRSLDEEEFLEIDWVTLGWLVDRLRAHQLPDVKTQIAVHWLERIYSGAWPWPAFDL